MYGENKYQQEFWEGRMITVASALDAHKESRRVGGTCNKLA